jgi:MtrB/PioB family decaheme-associated outer membrane protein
MKTNIIILTLILSLVALSDAFPQDKMIEGEVSVEGIWVDVDAKQGGKAKFTEYRDLEEDGAIYGGAKLKFDTDKYFLNFDAADFGYDTQHYKIDSGMWGKFKLDLFYDEIPHNFTFDARSTFSGAGSDTLTGTPNRTIRSWDTFDYSIERRQYGGGFQIDIIKPFFFDASFQREEREGIKPTGVAETSPGGIAFELPEPVNYTTNNLNVKGGYAKKPFFISFNYFLSEYNNSNTGLNLPPNFDPPNVFSLPPDNTYHKGAFKGAINLPFNSKFSTNIGFASGESETSIFQNFDGKVNTQNYDFALASNPVHFLDAKVYYKFYKRNNKSDQSQNPFSLETADLFLDYKISTYGGELGFRLPAQLYLSGGYEYVKTKRDKENEADPLEILPFDKDNVYHVDLRWTGLDFLSAGVGYERFDRDADYRTTESEEDPAKRYYYASQNRNTYKAAVDIFPLENLNFGLEYRHKSIDYTDTIFGLRDQKNDEFGTSVDYMIGKIAKLYGYGDFGWIKFKQRQFDNTGLPWEAEQKDRTWGYGVGTEVYVIPQKLTLVFQHDYLKSNGSIDYTLDPGLFLTGGLGDGVTNTTGANNENVDIGQWDDYILYCFKIKTVYHFTKSLLASLGYAYERFKYSDAQLDNYQFAPTAPGPSDTNKAFLTGAYKDQSYKAHLVFGGVTYQF